MYFVAIMEDHFLSLVIEHFWAKNQNVFIWVEKNFQGILFKTLLVFQSCNPFAS